MLICLAFAFLSGYILYLWNNQFNEKMKKKKLFKTIKEDNSGGSVNTDIGGGDNEGEEDDEEKKSIRESMSEDEISITNPKMLFFLMGLIGFFVGNISREVLVFESFNIFTLLVIMIIFVLIIYKALSIKLFFHTYKLLKNIKEFLLWKRQQRRRSKKTSARKKTE